MGENVYKQQPNIPVIGDRLVNLIEALRETQFSTARVTSKLSKITKSPLVGSSSVKILAADPARIGLIIYNPDNSAVYISYGVAALIGSTVSLEIPGKERAAGDSPVYTGDVFAVRTGGTSYIFCTEFF